MLPSTISGLLTAQVTATFPQSKTLPLLVNPISSAIAGWISNPLYVQIYGATTGVAGAGNVQGFISGVLGFSVVLPALQAAGLTGSTVPSTAQIFEQGMRGALMGAMYQGTSAGVGSGSDVITKITTNGATLAVQLQALLTSAGLAGSLTPTFCAGLGQGIATLVSTCVGAGSVTGPGGNIPAVGTSLSRFA